MPLDPQPLDRPMSDNHTPNRINGLDTTPGQRSTLGTVASLSTTPTHRVAARCSRDAREWVIVGRLLTLFRLSAIRYRWNRVLQRDAVTSIMAQASRRIVTEVHDEPHLEGRRVTVRRIQALVERAGKSAAEVSDQFDLEVADVYAALQYYHTHPEEMAAAERKQRKREANARQSGATSLAELQQERDEEMDDVSDSS